MTKTIADGIVAEMGKNGSNLDELRAAGAQRERSDTDTADITSDLEALAALDDLADATAEEAAKQTPTQKLGEFRLSKLELAMLDLALVNVSENKGVGIEDPLQRQAVQDTAQLLKLADVDLSKAIDFIIDGAESTAAPGMIYRLCFQIQKALLFTGNLVYRKALDPLADFDITKYVDYREELRPAPYGLEPITDIDHDGRERMHADDMNHEVVERALENLHIYLQLVTEAFGWDPENPMPYCFVQQKDETFKPIHDLVTALDVQEVKSKEARTRRAERNAKNMAATLAAARAALSKASAKA